MKASLSWIELIRKMQFLQTRTMNKPQENKLNIEWTRNSPYQPEEDTTMKMNRQSRH